MTGGPAWKHEVSWNTQDASAAGMREPWMGWETLRSKRCQVCGKCTLIDLNGLYNSQAPGRWVHLQVRSCGRVWRRQGNSLECGGEDEEVRARNRESPMHGKVTWRESDKGHQARIFSCAEESRGTWLLLKPAFIHLRQFYWVMAGAKMVRKEEQ